MFGIIAGTVRVYPRRGFPSAPFRDPTYFTTLLAVAIALCGTVQMTLAPVDSVAGPFLWGVRVGELLRPFSCRAWW
jgi:hypothetical protein